MSKGQNVKTQPFTAEIKMTGRFRGNLPDRTFDFAALITDLIDELPNKLKGWEYGKQLLKSGTSIGANVHEASEALTDAEFTNKCSIARKEAAETRYWLRLCQRCNLLRAEKAAPAIQEAGELLSILSTIVKKTQQHLALKQ